MNPAVAELRAALVNEICAPELLPRAAVADELADLLADQQRLVDEMAAKGGGGGGGAGAGVALSLYQQDIERVRFLVASYARVRLRKVRVLARAARPGGRARMRVRGATAAGLLFLFLLLLLLLPLSCARALQIEQQHFYIWHADDVKARLTPAERALLGRFVTARAGHLMLSVITKLPPRAAADTDGTLAAMADSMRPALKTHVFAEVLESVEGIVPDDQPDEEPIDLVAGHDVLVQYALVRTALLEGKVQLH